MAKRKDCKNNGSCSNKKNCGTNKNCGAGKVQAVPVKVSVAQAKNTNPEPAAPPQQRMEVSTQQLTSDTSPATIRERANKFYDLFDRYSKLRELARQLKGLPQNSAYPAHVKITKIDIEFTINGIPHTAAIADSRIVGELASLIANEISALIEQMYTEVFMLNHVTAAMQKTIEDSIVTRNPPAAGAVENNATLADDEQ